ncbi:metalloendopeptidase [Elysia marginata]|uniref:Metalloendopeptidase n=1 Tax=Elysia marginata TaxID=1093978 RepID=A0AAV4I746_9GAST|nr:metalloendopeptidase [Elysia marginata]
MVNLSSPSPPGTCKNLYDDVQCEIWAQKLKCIEDHTWMGTHCAKSCRRGLCEGKDPDDKDKSTRAPPPPDRTTSTTTTTTRRPRPPRTTTPSVVDPTCRNKHSSDIECDIWADNDHCNINPQWMLNYCAKACGQCSVGTTKGKPDTGDGGDGDSDCVDTRTECATWAKHGHCDRNPSYNLVYCKKSCNNCNGCRDAEFLCSVWAKSGNCRRNPSYMLRHCQKSCNVCEKSQEEKVSSDGGPASGAGSPDGFQGDKNNSRRQSSSLFGGPYSCLLLAVAFLLFM